MKKYQCENDKIKRALTINPLTSPREVDSVFTAPYLSAGAPALGEVKGLMDININSKINKMLVIFIDILTERL